MTRHGKRCRPTGDGYSMEGLKRELKSAREKKDMLEASELANVIANHYLRDGKYRKALKFFLYDYKLSREVNRGVLTSVRNLGEVYLKLEDRRKSLYFLKKHLDLAQAESNNEEIQRAHVQLGRFYLSEHERLDGNWRGVRMLKLAKQHFHESLKLAETLNLPTEKVGAHLNLGAIYIESEDFTAAEKHLKKAQDLYKYLAQGEAGIQSGIYSNWSVLLKRRGNYVDAMSFIEKDVALCKSVQDIEGEGKAYINQGELFTDLREFEKASAAYGRALRCFRQLEEDVGLHEQTEQVLEVSKRRSIAATKINTLVHSLTTVNETETRRSILKDLVNLCEESLDWEGVRKHARQLLLLEQKKDNVDGQGEALYRLTLALSEGKLHREAIQVCALYASFCEDCGSPNDIRWAEHHAIALINKGHALDHIGQTKDAEKAYMKAKEVSETAWNKNRKVDPAKSKCCLEQQASALENLHYLYYHKRDLRDDGKRRETEKQLSHVEKLLGRDYESNMENSVQESFDIDPDGDSDCCSDVSSSPERRNRQMPVQDKKNAPKQRIKASNQRFNKEGGDVLRILDVESPKRNRSESVHRQVTPDNSRHHSAQQTLRRAIIVESSDEDEPALHSKAGFELPQTEADTNFKAKGYSRLSKWQHGSNNALEDISNQDQDKKITSLFAHSTEVAASAPADSLADPDNLQPPDEQHTLCRLEPLPDFMTEASRNQAVRGEIDLKGKGLNSSHIRFLKRIMPKPFHSFAAGEQVLFLDASGMHQPAVIVDQCAGSSSSYTILVPSSTRQTVVNVRNLVPLDIPRTVDECNNLVLDISDNELADDYLLAVREAANCATAYHSSGMKTAGNTFLGLEAICSLTIRSRLCKLSPASLHHLSLIPRVVGLNIDLSCNELEGPNCPANIVDHIESFLRKPYLSHLKLERCGLTSRSFIKLGEHISSAEVLKSLHVGRNESVDDNAVSKLLLGCSRSPRLQLLDVAYMNMGSEAAQSLATLLVHSKALTSLNIAGCCLGRPPTLSSFKSAILEKSVNFEADDILSASLAKKRCLSIDVSCNDLTESRMVELFRIFLQPGVFKGLVVTKLVARENLPAEEQGGGEMLSQYLEKCFSQNDDLRVLDLSSNGLGGAHVERIQRAWERQGGMAQACSTRGRLILNRL